MAAVYFRTSSLCFAAVAMMMMMMVLSTTTVMGAFYICSDSRCSKCQGSSIPAYTCSEDPDDGTSVQYTCPSDGSSAAFEAFSSPDCTGTPTKITKLGRPGVCTPTTGGDYTLVTCSGSGPKPPAPPPPPKQIATLKVCTDTKCESCKSTEYESGACYYSGSNSAAILCGSTITYFLFSNNECLGSPAGQIDLGAPGTCTQLSQGSISAVCSDAASVRAIVAMLATVILVILCASW